MRRIIVRIMKCKKIWPFIAKDTYFGNCEIQGLKLRRIFSPYFELNPHLTPPPFFPFQGLPGAGSDHPRTKIYLCSDLGW